MRRQLGKGVWTNLDHIPEQKAMNGLVLSDWLYGVRLSSRIGEWLTASGLALVPLPLSAASCVLESESGSRENIFWSCTSAVQSKFVQKYGNAFDTAAIAEEQTSHQSGRWQTRQKSDNSTGASFWKKENWPGEKVKLGVVLHRFFNFTQCIERAVQWFFQRRSFQDLLSTIE